MPDVISLTFTDSTGASITRTAGPDLALVADSALWDQRTKDTLNWHAEDRSGEVPANLGVAVQSFVDVIYERLRAKEKSLRTDAAVAAAEATEDTQIPDE